MAKLAFTVLPYSEATLIARTAEHNLTSIMITAKPYSKMYNLRIYLTYYSYWRGIIFISKIFLLNGYFRHPTLISAAIAIFHWLYNTTYIDHSEWKLDSSINTPQIYINYTKEHWRVCSHFHWKCVTEIKLFIITKIRTIRTDKKQPCKTPMLL